MRNQQFKPVTSGLVAIFMLVASEARSDEFVENIPVESTVQSLNKAELAVSILGTAAQAAGDFKLQNNAGAIGAGISGGKAAYHLYKGKGPEAAGALIGGGLGLLTVGSACAAGMILGPVGCVVAGALAVKASGAVGNSATEFFRPKNQSPLWKRASNVNFDPSRFLSERQGTGLAGDGLQARADMLRELLDHERIAAIRQGKGHMPNAFTEDEIANLESRAALLNKGDGQNNELVEACMENIEWMGKEESRRHCDQIANICSDLRAGKSVNLLTGPGSDLLPHYEDESEKREQYVLAVSRIRSHEKAQEREPECFVTLKGTEYERTVCTQMGGFSEELLAEARRIIDDTQKDIVQNQCNQKPEVEPAPEFELNIEHKNGVYKSPEPFRLEEPPRVFGPLE